MASSFLTWPLFHAEHDLERLWESRVRGNVPALFGGEGLAFLGNQDPASYPTLFVRITPTGQTCALNLHFCSTSHFLKSIYNRIMS